jgi:tRNA(His) 5'-end guanylyltransferase
MPTSYRDLHGGAPGWAQLHPPDQRDQAFLTPYDEAFRDAMLETAEHLMDCGLRVIYAYTHSDEISLLFHPEENAYNRLMRKYISILAGEASAKLSLLLGDLATFDCRISQLPAVEQVLDYFLWRSEDARRNALSSHCYWALRKAGKTPKEAGEELNGSPSRRRMSCLPARGRLRKPAGLAEERHRPALGGLRKKRHRPNHRPGGAGPPL